MDLPKIRLWLSTQSTYMGTWQGSVVTCSVTIRRAVIQGPACQLTQPPCRPCPAAAITASSHRMEPFNPCKPSTPVGVRLETQSSSSRLRPYRGTEEEDSKSPVVGEENGFQYTSPSHTRLVTSAKPLKASDLNRGDDKACLSTLMVWVRSQEVRETTKQPKNRNAA